MSEEKPNVPKLRFPGFADPWEQRKLGEIAHRIIRKNGGNQSNLPLTISAQYGLVDQRDYFNNQVASRDMSGYYLLQNGEFAYNKSTSGDSPWGAVKRLTKYENGCVSTLYICFGLDEGDSDFLVTYYETDRWHKEVRMIAAEGARNHGLLNIAPSDFFETELTMPAEIEEQAQIGAFFQQLDSLITLHQRKLDHLKEMKKGLLQKMFPKNGESIPELRFPGFTDPWEQRKFSDLFSYERPDAYIVNNDEYDDSNPTPVLTANKGFILGYTAETRTHEGPCVIFDDFTLDCKLVTFPFMVKSSAMKILHCHDGVDLTFAYERLCSAKIEALGHARHYISVVQNTESAIPSYEEQSAIGRVLSNLDTLITLHQRKLDHLKQMKKGLLQQMFV